MPAGPANANHVPASYPGTPDSATVGRFGSRGMRFGVAAATPNRIPRLPNLPTVAESGVPGYEAGTWFALAGPAGMPREVTYSIYNEVKKVLNEPSFKERYIDKQW